jgi:hypothetical protein
MRGSPPQLCCCLHIRTSLFNFSLLTHIHRASRSQTFHGTCLFTFITRYDSRCWNLRHNQRIVEPGTHDFGYIHHTVRFKDIINDKEVAASAVARLLEPSPNAIHSNLQDPNTSPLFLTCEHDTNEIVNVILSKFPGGLATFTGSLHTLCFQSTFHVSTNCWQALY